MIGGSEAMRRQRYRLGCQRGLPEDDREAARLNKLAADKRDAVTKEVVSRRGHARYRNQCAETGDPGFGALADGGAASRHGPRRTRLPRPPLTAWPPPAQGGAKNHRCCPNNVARSDGPRPHGWKTPIRVSIVPRRPNSTGLLPQRTHCCVRRPVDLATR